MKEQIEKQYSKHTNNDELDVSYFKISSKTIQSTGRILPEHPVTGQNFCFICRNIRFLTGEFQKMLRFGTRIFLFLQRHM